MYWLVVNVFSLSTLQNVPLILLLIMLIIQFYTHPYDDVIANYLESFVLFVLVVLLSLGNTTAIVRASLNQPIFTLWPLFYLPVFVGVIVAIVYISYKTW